MKKQAFSLLLVMVFAAGAASLLYEVVWVRLLGLSLGSTAVASSVMLSAFLAGLALGSWISGRFADRVRSPLKVMFWIELAAAIVGALSIPALTYAGRAYVLVATITSAGSLASLALRAGFSLVVMLVPATVFGATFPMTTAAGARLVSLEVAVGGVSAASFFGSAVGAAVTGLYLEPTMGLAVSAFIGAGINVAVALLALGALRVAEAAPSGEHVRDGIAREGDEDVAEVVS